MPEHQWLTYSEIAARFGISKDAARMLSKRRDWHKKPGNHPGAQIRILVPEGAEAPEQISQTFTGVNEVNIHPSSPEQTPQVRSPVHPGDQPHMPVSRVMEMIAEERSRSDRQLADQQARHDAEMACRITEIQTTHLDHLNRFQAQAALERSLWLERVDAAELRSERVEQRLDQVLDQLLNQRAVMPTVSEPLGQPVETDKEPFWRRLFGSSKRSKIGGQ